jgi:hypothetical protein
MLAVEQLKNKKRRCRRRKRRRRRRKWLVSLQSGRFSSRSE